MIVAAAIKFGDVIAFVPAPGRHHNVLHGLHASHGKRTRGYDVEVQGFITEGGTFLNRREAFDHAEACGQPLTRRIKTKQANPNCYDGDELFSEDLW